MPLNDYYKFINGGNTMGDIGSTTGGGTIASDSSGGHNSAAIGADYATDESRTDLLNRIHQYDPSATINQRTQMLGGDDAKPYTDYYLNYDASKLPVPGGTSNKQTPTVASSTPGQQAFNSGGWNTYASVQGNGGTGNLRNPGLVANDQTYGQLTLPQNVRPQPTDWLDKYAGLFMGAASFGIGALGGAVAGTGAMAGGQAAFGGSKLPNAAVGAARSIGNGTFNPLTTAANIGLNYAGLPAPVSTLARVGIGMASQPHLSSPQQQPQQTQSSNNSRAAALRQAAAIQKIIANRKGR